MVIRIFKFLSSTCSSFKVHPNKGMCQKHPQGRCTNLAPSPIFDWAHLEPSTQKFTTSVCFEVIFFLMIFLMHPKFSILAFDRRWLKNMIELNQQSWKKLRKNYGEIQKRRVHVEENTTPPELAENKEKEKVQTPEETKKKRLALAKQVKDSWKRWRKQGEVVGNEQGKIASDDE